MGKTYPYFSFTVIQIKHVFAAHLTEIIAKVRFDFTENSFGFVLVVFYGIEGVYIRSP